MLKIEAIVRPERIHSVTDALEQAGCGGFHYLNVTGQGKQRGVEVFTGRGAQMVRARRFKDPRCHHHPRRPQRRRRQRHRGGCQKSRRRRHRRRQDHSKRASKTSSESAPENTAKPPSSQATLGEHSSPDTLPDGYFSIGLNGKVQRRGVSGGINRLSRRGRFKERYTVVEIIERDPLFLPPFPHPPIATVAPRQHLNPPSSAAHTLQVGVKTDPVRTKPLAVSGQQHCYSRIPVVVRTHRAASPFAATESTPCSRP